MNNEPPIVRKKREVRTPPIAAQSDAPKSKWSLVLDNRWAMLGMLFFVTGFLGIPLLWMSPKFGRNEKTIWSIIVTIYTCTLIGGTIAICVWSYNQISDMLR